MKIKIINNKNYKLFFFIEKKRVTIKDIVPIGCDCHTAHLLQKLNLRKYSLPFDWLYTNPVKGIEFVTKNNKESFQNFQKICFIILMVILFQKNILILSLFMKKIDWIIPQVMIN